MTERDYWIAFNMIDGVGTARFLKLREYFGTAEKAWHAGEKELARVEGIGSIIASQIVNGRQRIDVNNELIKIRQHNISVLTLGDEAYPALLREIYNPPMVMYVWGTIHKEDEKAVAMVGSRRATSYGRDMAVKIADEFVKSEITVVSGMAAGIDSCAHWAAIKGGGRTLAVLGCGLDVVYPPQNRELMQEIASNGAVLSEFPLGTKPEARHFPRRNRVISGLSLGTVVIEAAQKSGSLITADFALEQGREVLAVPGSVHSKNSKGTHALIKQGAKLIENAADVLEELGMAENKAHDKKPMVIPADLSPQEKEMAQMLLTGNQSLDALAKRSTLTLTDISTALLMLEMKGRVRQLPGKIFQWMD